MNLGGRENIEGSQLKIVSLFDRRKYDFQDIPETNFFDQTAGRVPMIQKDEALSQLVHENQFPDQSIYTLEEQLKIVKSKLNRIKFYLEELEDILP